MGYLLGFGLLIFGYALTDWGYQRTKSRHISMWYLLSGVGLPTLPTAAASTPVSSRMAKSGGICINYSPAWVPEPTNEATCKMFGGTWMTQVGAPK